MGIQTGAGSKLAISAGVPATHDAAGFAALTYTNIGYVENFGGTIGPTPNKVTFQPLDGPTIKLKGSTDYGMLSPNIGQDTADAGQILAEASAAAGNTMYSMRATRPDGSIRYFRTITFGWPEGIEGADGVITVKPSFEINSTIVKVP